MSAQEEIRNQDAQEQDKAAANNPLELQDFDESAAEIDNWDQTEQFAKYTAKNVEKAEEQFHQRKSLRPGSYGKTQLQIKKEEAAKALDDDVEGVQ